MRRIAIINQKGGVGKTTTAVNLSAALAEAGKKVWLADLDPQAHASLHLGFHLDEDQPTMYDIMTDDIPFDLVRHEAKANLFITPAHIDLAAAEMELAGEVGREIILRDKLNENTEDFDYLIFDCPPSLGLLTLNALTTVEEVFLPLQPHFLALHGLSKLLRTVDLVARRLNKELRLSNLIYCLFETGTRLANEVVNDVELFFEEQKDSNKPWANATSFQTRIRRNIRLAEAPSYGKSIFEYAPTSNGAQDYHALAAEVIAQESSSPKSIVNPQLVSTNRTPSDRPVSSSREPELREPVVQHHQAGPVDDSDLDSERFGQVRSLPLRTTVERLSPQSIDAIQPFVSELANQIDQHGDVSQIR